MQPDPEIIHQSRSSFIAGMQSQTIARVILTQTGSSSARQSIDAYFDIFPDSGIQPDSESPTAPPEVKRDVSLYKPKSIDATPCISCSAMVDFNKDVTIYDIVVSARIGCSKCEFLCQCSIPHLERHGLDWDVRLRSFFTNESWKISIWKSSTDGTDAELALELEVFTTNGMCARFPKASTAENLYRDKYVYAMGPCS